MRPSALPHVPVTMGSPRFRTFEATGCTVTEAWFPPGAVLAPHTHDRPIFGIMLGGAFQSAIARRLLDCPVSAAWVEPRAERHGNFIGRAGARVLVVQPDLEHEDLFGPFAKYLDEVRYVRHAGIAADARRLAAELVIADDVSPLAIDGLVQTMLAAAVRAWTPRGAQAPPPWLLRAQEMLHAHFRERVSVAGVADTVGVSPWHLARAFRAHFRAAPADYVRRLRVEWAADQLARTEMSLAEVAAAAGFSDQSHLTREFVRCLGVTPGVYRRRSQNGRESGAGSREPGLPRGAAASRRLPSLGIRAGADGGARSSGCTPDSRLPAPDSR